MDIVMPKQNNKPPVHPVEIFRQSFKFYRLNLAKLSAIYVIFNLPLTLLSLTPQIKALQNQQPTLATWVWFLLLILFSSWGHIALLLGAQKPVPGQTRSVWQNISQGQWLLVKYLSLIAGIFLFIVGLLVTGMVLGLLISFLSKVNMILVILLYVILLVAVICLLVYFLLRWSLASAVCVFEQTWPMPALNQSLALLKNYINPLTGLYGVMILAYGIGLLPVILVQSMAKVNAENPAVQTGITLYLFLVNTALATLWATVTVGLYQKLKEIAGAHVHA